MSTESVKWICDKIKYGVEIGQKMTAAVSEQTAWFGLVKQDWNLVGNNLIYILNKTLKNSFIKLGVVIYYLTVK